MTSSSQGSLFADEPPKSTRIVEVLAARKPADRAEAAFRRLVEKLEARREALLAWQAYRTRFSQRVAAEVAPLEIEFRLARRELVLLFDEHLERVGGLRGKRQRAKLRHLLVDLARALLLEEADEALEALHDKHSEVSHAEEHDAEMALSQTMIESLTGVDLSELHGAQDIEELFIQAEHKLREQAENGNAAEAPRPRRRSAKAEAAQVRREQAALAVSQTVRDIYRKLARALHPDRETDPALREHKTAQMQRLNQAYEAGDLLTLLTLQLEIEQIDAAHLSSLPRERLAHYNQVLREQVAELDAEIEAFIMPFRQAAPDVPRTLLTPEAVDRCLSVDIARLRADIAQAREDLDEFREPAKLARFLKDYRPSGNARDEMMRELAELAEFAELMQAFSAPPPPPRREKRKK